MEPWNPGGDVGLEVNLVCRISALLLGFALDLALSLPRYASEVVEMVSRFAVVFVLSWMGNCEALGLFVALVVFQDGMDDVIGS